MGLLQHFARRLQLLRSVEKRSSFPQGAAQLRGGSAVQGDFGAGGSPAFFTVQVPQVSLEPKWAAGDVVLRARFLVESVPSLGSAALQ